MIAAVAGVGLAFGGGLLALIALAGQWRYHTFLQRSVAPESVRAAAAPVARGLTDYLLGTAPTLDDAWRRAQAPEAARLDQADRHLAEVRHLLRRVRRVGVGSLIVGAIGLGALRGRWRVGARVAGVVSVVGGVGGLVVSAIIFPVVWQRYHAVAYDTDDWRLPDEALLARLYPESFYQRAAIGWFALWTALGALAIVASSGRTRRR